MEGDALPSLERFRSKRIKREIEFQLPIVMEQIVCAVQSGLDILPALNAVVDISSPIKKKKPLREILLLIKNLTDCGIGFEESLRYVTNNIDCLPLSHAFIHLALAHREGGGIIGPLRELSDTTQLYYQESVEEEIARLPFKAMFPLLITFAGLIVCFLTAPLVQLLVATTQTVH